MTDQEIFAALAEHPDILTFAKAIRAAALEEAAQICYDSKEEGEPIHNLACNMCAEAIYSLDGSSEDKA